MKVRITCDKYIGPVGRIVEVSKEKIQGLEGDYYAGAAPDNLSVYVNHCVVVGPKLYTHKGVEYELPEWVKFVTCDGLNHVIDGGLPLIGWENKPSDAGGYGDVRANFQDVTDGKRDSLKVYNKPLPEGAFIKEV